MPAKKSTRSKSRQSSNRRSQNKLTKKAKFPWWVVVVSVAVVAIIGIVIVRISNAGVGRVIVGQSSTSDYSDPEFYSFGCPNVYVMPYKNGQVIVLSKNTPTNNITRGCVEVLKRALGQKYPDSPYATTLNWNFNSTTESWVKRFQSDSGLTPDGIVGAATWRKILEFCKTSNGC